MTWIGLSAISAILLGVYDVAKKVSVRNNAVPIVLLVSVTFGALLWTPFLIWSSISPETIPHSLLVVDSLPWGEIGLVFAKSVLVGTSWTFAFFALKQLPISIAAPIRSTSPVWTLALAILLLGERPSMAQWIGILIVLGSFWLFSAVGHREGVSFSSHRGVALMIVATILGAISSIYDKYLLQTRMISPSTVQAYFTVFLVPVMMPMAFLWWYEYKKNNRGNPDQNEFALRSSIFTIAPLLLAADIIYFTAIADPNALVSIVSVIRRCSVVIAFSVGIKMFDEANLWPKAGCVAGILVGVVILALGG